MAAPWGSAEASPARRGVSTLQSADADPAILHLPAVALEADRAALRQLHLALEELAVAGRARDAALHLDHELVPLLRPVALQALVGAGEGVVAALQLRPAQVDAAVGERRGAELEPQLEVLGELARRPELLDLAVLGRRRDHEAPADRAEAAVRALAHAVEARRFGDEWPLGGVRVRRLPARGARLVGLARRAVAPAREVPAVEEALEALLGREGIGCALAETQRREHGPQRRRPLGVADLVRVEEVGELAGLRVAAPVREELPGLERDHAAVVLDRGQVERVQRLDLLDRTFLRGGAREHQAQHDPRLG